MFGLTRKKSKLPKRVEYLDALSRRDRIRAAHNDGAESVLAIENHFARATSGSADAHYNASERRKVRIRSRFEVQNNAYMKGMLRSYRNDFVGRMPRIQLMLDAIFGDNLSRKRIRQIASEVERKWILWAKEVRLGRKLRCMLNARVQDGEAFALLRTNRNLPGPVKLDLKLIEADRIGDPIDFSLLNSQYVSDGIKYDNCDRPVSYYIYKYHPGDPRNGGDLTGNWEPADNVIHWFTLERPEQHHGIGEFNASLTPAAHSRRWRSATVQSAEAAASINAIAYTDAPVDPYDDTLEQPAAYDTIDLPHNSILTMPDSWKTAQLKAEHPNAHFTDLHQQTTTEQGRPLNMHRAKSLGDASDYNYASVQFDNQDYQTGITVDRDDIEYDLDRLFAQWWDEAILIEGYLPNELRQLIGPEDYPSTPPHEWHFDGRGHVDPTKEANAAKTRCEIGISNPVQEIKNQGDDAETVLEESARFYGVDVEEYQRLLREKTFGPGGVNNPADDDTDEDDGKTKKKRNRQPVQ